MTGSMRQRGEATWQLRVHVGTDPISGRKRYVAKTFHGPKRQAQRALADLASETGSFVPRKDWESSFSRLLEEWLEHAAPSLSPKTVAVDGGYVRTTIIPVLGKVPVAKLTPVGLDRFYRHLLEVGGPKEPYTPATVKRVHGIIRRALALGVRWGWLRHNPALDASPPRVPLRPMHPPTSNEVAGLFCLASERHPTLAASVDVRTVAARLGHRNPATTLNVYAHFVPEVAQQAADVLGRVFGEAMEQQQREQTAGFDSTVGRHVAASQSKCAKSL